MFHDMSNIFVNCCTNDSSSRLCPCGILYARCLYEKIRASENKALLNSPRQQPDSRRCSERKRGKIYLNRALKYIFLFMSKTGCFRLCVIFQGLKTVQKCKIGLDLVCFELKTAKSAKSIGRASYAEAKKSAERSSKRRIELQKGGWHFVYFT